LDLLLARLRSVTILPLLPLTRTCSSAFAAIESVADISSPKPPMSTVIADSDDEDLVTAAEGALVVPNGSPKRRLTRGFVAERVSI
jgi:hypothetical protein